MKFNYQRIFLVALTGIVFLLYSSCTKDILDDTEVLQATQLNAAISKTVTLAPIQDAYLKYNGIAYNSSLVRLDGSQRQGYLMFDLSNISGQITSASLQFTVTSDAGNGTVKAYLANGTNWTETNLSDQNKPSTGALLASINKTYSIGATEKITLNSSKITGGKISLVLVHSGGNDLAFASGETSNAPKLTITYSSSGGGSNSSTTESESSALAPIQDAYLKDNGIPYNSSLVRLDGNQRQGYLMFDLSNINGQITSASLQFTVTSDAGNGTVKAYLGNGTNWTETNLSNQNKPSIGALLGSIDKSYNIGATEKITLNSSQITGGKISLVLVHSAGNDLAFASAETSNAPKLLVTYGADSGSGSGPSTTAPSTPTTDPNRVNFSKYGAVGNGSTDDTKALQAALNSEKSLVANPGATFKISSTLKIIRGFEQNINWNGATIITYSALDPMIKIDKRIANGGATTMSGLNVDGKGKASRGIGIYSRVAFDNIDIRDFKQTGQSSASGLILRLYNHSSSRGEYLFNRVNIDKTVGKSNGTITDALGVANGMSIYWKEVPSSTTNIIVQNGSIHSSWGEDGGLVFTADQTSNNGISRSSSSITFKNMNFYDYQRRAIKGFSSNVTYDNCKFTDPSPNNPNIKKNTGAGLVAVGSGSKNIKFNNCEFVDRGYDGRFIASDVDDLEIRNSVFKGGAEFILSSTIGDITLSNNSFSTGSTIRRYSATFTGKVVIKSNNTGPSGFIKLSPSNWSR